MTLGPLPLDDVLLGCRALVLTSPRLADIPGHLLNQDFTKPAGMYWEESMDVLDEYVAGMCGGAAFGGHLQETTIEYVVTIKAPENQGTGAVFRTAKEVADLCAVGTGLILASGQATVGNKQRLGPRSEDDDFVMRVRLDIIAYGLG